MASKVLWRVVLEDVVQTVTLPPPHSFQALGAHHRIGGCSIGIGGAKNKALWREARSGRDIALMVFVVLLLRGCGGDKFTIESTL